MDPEIRTFVAELFNSTPKCACFASCSAADVRNAASEKNRFDSAAAETSQARLALELSVSDISMDLNWNPNDFSVEDLVVHMSEKDLSTVRLLSEKTKEVAEVAYAYAVKGRVASLTALLIAAAEKVNDSVLEVRDSQIGATIYECLIRQALALGGRTTQPLRAARRASTATEESENLERRKLLLRAIELLQHFGASTQSSGGHKKKKKNVTTPLIRAAKVLLLEDPVGVQYRTERKETPLCFAVRNESKECAKLLLTWGANAEVNLRQRAIDLAASSDMCHILLNQTTVGHINHAFPSQYKCMASELIDEDTSTPTECSRVSTAVDVDSSIKAKVCKYFDSHRGCARGAKCFNAHCEEEFQKAKEGADQSHSSAGKSEKCAGKSFLQFTNRRECLKVLHKLFDAKNRQCFFNVDEDKDLAKAILQVKEQFGQLDGLLSSDSVLFKSSRWKVLFSGNFLKLLKKLMSVRWKRLTPKDLRYIQELKIWDILAMEDVPTLVKCLEGSASGRSHSTSFYPQYNKGSSHGTTIFWVQLGNQVLVGVDSQQTREWIGDKSNNYRRFELMMSGEDKKFIQIINGVCATLCGDATRCWMMVDHVRELLILFTQYMQLYADNESVAIQTEPALKDVGEFAGDFFLRNPRSDPKGHQSIVHLCAWMPLLEEYHIIFVGDLYHKPRLMIQKVFGCGSGSGPGLKQLTTLKVPINADIIMHELIKAATTDPYTGGYLEVWSLSRGSYTRVRQARLINKLRDPTYANMLFNGKNMFVIIRSIHGHILSPPDLLQHLEQLSRFEACIKRADILWLCFPMGFIVYLVRLPSRECCDDWFDSCQVFKQPIRQQRYTNTDNESCDYYLAYATSEMYDRALRMSFFEDLADPRVLNI